MGLLKIIIHLINGAPISSVFKSVAIVSFTENEYYVKVEKSAIFSNFLGIKSRLDAIPSGLKVTIDLKRVKFIDHSVMENLSHYKHDYESIEGGLVEIIGLEKHKSLSDHQLAARKLK